MSEPIGTGPALLFNPDGTLKERLLFGIPDSEPFYNLIQWAEAANAGPFTREFHRLQVEHWVWRHVTDYRDHHENISPEIIDVGVYHRRDWLGCDRYRTLGIDPNGTNDLTLDLVNPETLIPNPVDIVICTEVLEHVEHPFAAMATLWELLQLGGLLIASSPFLWPDHQTDDYPDYWRFTRQGWQQLFTYPTRYLNDGQHACWRDIEIVECLWTRYGRMAYDLMCQTEGMVEHRGSPTGFLVKATKC